MKAGFAQAAENAIEDLFSDMSVSKRATLKALLDLRTNLDFKIEALKTDIKREGKD